MVNVNVDRVQYASEDGKSVSAVRAAIRNSLHTTKDDTKRFGLSF